MRKKLKIISVTLLLTAAFLFFSFQNFSATFSQEIPHETLSGDQISPSLAYNDSGHYMLTWISIPQDDGLPGVYGRLFYQNGYPIGPEFQVNNFWNPVEYPAIAGSPSGFVVAWGSLWQEGGVSGAVTARLFNSWGDPLGDEFRVNEYTWDFQGNPDVAMDAQGRFIITWQSWEQDGDGYGVFARIFNSNGDPDGSEFQVTSSSLGHQAQPAVAAASDGGFIIIWRSCRDETAHSGIFGQRFDRFGNPLGPEFQANFTTFGTAESPDIDIDSLGNFYISWHHNYLDENGYDIYVRTFDSTGTLRSEEIRVNSSASGMQVFPSLSCTQEGEFLVSWLDRNENIQIKGRTFDAYGNPLSDTFLVSSAQNVLRDYPDAKLINLNNMVFTWQEYNNRDEGWNLAQKIISQRSVIFREEINLPKEKNQGAKNPVRSPDDGFSNFTVR
jgi:hypothetical protein